MATILDEDVETGYETGLNSLSERLIVAPKKLSDNGGEGDDEASSKRMVLLSTAVVVCGSFEFGSSVGYSAPTESGIRNDLSLSIAEYSMFGSIVTIGAMIGAVTSGRIADYTGRKRVPIYVAEIAPKNLRGGLATLNQLMIVCGSTTAFLLGTVVSWRTLALTGLVPCFILMLGLYFIPESPRWLVGRDKDFAISLRKLRGNEADISREAVEIKDYIDDLKFLPKSSFLDLFQRNYIRSVVIALGLMAFQQLGGINGIGFYASETFVSAGFSSGKQGTIAYACIQVPITVMGAVLMDRSGRRPLLLVSATGTFFGCFLTATSFMLKSKGLWLQSVPFLAASGVLIYIAFFSIGMGAVPWVIMSEIFPINVKGVAGSLAVLTGWVGAWVVSYTFNFMTSWSSSGGTFFIYSAFCGLTVVFVAKIVPETKGKTLEEIQSSIKG